MADFGIQHYLANSSRERESDKVEYVMIDHDLWSWVMWFFVGPSLWQSLPSLGKDSSLPPTPINQKLNRYLNSNSLFLWFTKTFTGKKTEIYLHEIEHSFQTLSSKQNYISAWVWMLQSLPISSFVGKINAKWGNNPFVTQQVGANLTTTGGGIKMFTHLVFDWFQYKRYERKFPHNLNISIQIFLRVLLYQFLLDRQNGDTTICQMSDTGLGFQSYFFCPYWFNCKSLPFFYFLTFEKGRLPYIHQVGRSVGWSVGVTINFFNI